MMLSPAHVCAQTSHPTPNPHKLGAGREFWGNPPWMAACSSCSPLRISALLGLMAFLDPSPVILLSLLVIPFFF